MEHERLGPHPHHANYQPRRVLFAAAEVAPFAKVGGLADVAGSLPRALHALGHDVRVIMPRYRSIDPRRFGLVPVGDPFHVSLGQLGSTEVMLLRGSINHVPIYFVESPAFFDRPAIYGEPDDLARFVCFCRAVLATPAVLGWEPEIVHANDWHTALLPHWLAQRPRRPATVLTIHNLGYQGVWDRNSLTRLGLDVQRLEPRRASAFGDYDLLTQGIVSADAITTVSPTYAREILTPELGEGLHDLLRRRQDRLFGILNGIEVAEFDPATDPHLVAPYSIDDLRGKALTKAALQREGGMAEEPDWPLIGIVSRLVDQKGFDLVTNILETLMTETTLQLVVLGTGQPEYQEMFREVAARYPGRAYVTLAFDSALAQRIYAGSDAFLMPSRYEPCGLGQMIALRYGTVPIVRKTGGLADTVEDYDPREGMGTGFVFQRYDPRSLLVAIVRALETYCYPESWQRLMRNGMARDVSWGHSAIHYAELYERAIVWAHRAG